ncbi:UNVERIFIED_CONTAM: hypothetical protein GTU68_020531 [Idotea baltica]|nr:hypothetical protein [Idotea baltica]
MQKPGNGFCGSRAETPLCSDVAAKRRKLWSQRVCRFALFPVFPRESEGWPMLASPLRTAM